MSVVESYNGARTEANDSFVFDLLPPSPLSRLGPFLLRILISRF